MKRVRAILLAAGMAAAFAAGGLSAVGLWARYGGGPRAPRIGIVVSREWYDRIPIQPAPYELALARAGAAVVRVECDGPARIEELDGIVLIGGGDVDPELFDGDAARAYAVDRARDAFEIELLRRAEARGLPVLAVCRGAQLLAVAHGGRLKNLEADPGMGRRHGVTLRSLAAHRVSILPGTRLHGLLGGGPHTVSSTHLQAIADPGPRLRAVAFAPDGVIEAVELPGERMVLGLQWHPEWESLAEARALGLFRAFVADARRVRPR